MPDAVRVSRPPTKPLVVFDGDCGFCTSWIRRWEQITGQAVDYLPAQTEGLAERFPEISPERYEVAVHLVEPDGGVYVAAEAIFRTLAYAPSSAWMLRLYRNSSLFARCSERTYRLVARHRGLFSRLTRWLWGRHVERTSHALAIWLFLRALGAIYLVAFFSLWSQIHGLVGHEGILPVDRLMGGLSRAYGIHGIAWERYRLVPTLCWLSSSDNFLAAQCAAGVVLALALLVDLAPMLSLGLLWLLYLSLATVGRDFLGFQWDNLLLECGFVAIFLAPARLWPRPPRTPDRSGVALWLPRLLLFKLMFSSGCVKLASHDPSWRNLTALSFHYQTQPLPTWVAWYANQLPLWIQKLSCALMFVVELGAPLLIFLPRRPRLLGACLLAALQVLILSTGNYTFFNWLTLALCVLLVDDITLRALLPRRLRGFASRPVSSVAAGRGRSLATGAFAIVFVSLSSFQVVSSTGFRSAWSSPLASAEAWLDPLRTISGYGLFAVMTTERREIVVEGSEDGEIWKPYELRYKPGEVNRRPGFVAPHQPRLDWQMWFAALGDARDNRWFLHFCARLLQGSRPVLALLANNPFPTHPPRFIRAELYRYHFTEASERRATGAWWHREHIGSYLPPVSLRDFGL